MQKTAQQVLQEHAEQQDQKNLTSGVKTWANAMNEHDLMAPSGKAASYRAQTYLPEANEWIQKQKTIEEESSRERRNTPNSLSPSNLENIEKNKRSYDRYLERKGLPPRRRSPSPRRRGSSPRRRGSSPRRRGSSPRHRRRHMANVSHNWRRQSTQRRRSPSPRRRSPSPRHYSRRRSLTPNVNEFGRNMTYNYRRSPRRSQRPRVSPLRYTVAANGRTVNEFGRNAPRYQSTRRRSPSGPRFFNEKTKTYRRPVKAYDEVSGTYKNMD